MPHIKPTSSQTRNAFRQKLPPSLRSDFDQLGNLIDNPRPGLDWYHAVGLLTKKFRQSAGPGWCTRLAGALGPRRWFFDKALHFVRLYPTPKHVERLRRIGADWSRVYLSFAIKSRKKRVAFLREAAEDNWTIPQFRYEMQERSLSPQPGVGGRRRLDPVTWGPRVCLRQLQGLIQPLLAFHEGTWNKVRAAEWKGFVKDCAGPEKEALAKLLQSAKEALASLGDAGADMRKKLDEMQVNA